MVGQCVLRQCLIDSRLRRVLSIGRSSSNLKDPKLREVLLKDLFAFAVPGETLQDYDACFFCLGVSAAGVNETDYARLTFELTTGWASILAEANATMTFIYVSGAGTGGRAKWAQVKKRTEDAVLSLFPNGYAFRLAALLPMNGEVSKTRWTRISYSLFRPLLPLVRAIAPAWVIKSDELGRAMIRVALEGAPKHVLENNDMIKLGQQ